MVRSLANPEINLDSTIVIEVLKATNSGLLIGGEKIRYSGFLYLLPEFDFYLIEESLRPIPPTEFDWTEICNLKELDTV
jgi:hypothetical protein